jgi:hypothetical protein
MGTRNIGDFPISRREGTMVQAANPVAVNIKNPQWPTKCSFLFIELLISNGVAMSRYESFVYPVERKATARKAMIG